MKFTTFMDLFTPVVPEEKLHPNFRYLISQPGLFTQEIEVIKSWAEGFVERDGKDKFIKEFQTTFSSSFWELYLFACFKELGCTVDFSHSKSLRSKQKEANPDFVINSPFGEFIAEAVTAQEPQDFRPEWDKDIQLLNQTSMEDILRLSTIRLLSAIKAKSKKYIETYSKVDYVQNKPFVICVAPYEQPFSSIQGSSAISQVLYGYEATLTIPGDQEGEFSIIGESKNYRVQKKPGTELELGLFTNRELADVSAIIFSSLATLGKVCALAKEGNSSLDFFGYKVIQLNDGTGLQPFVESKVDYQETLLNGLHILINPFAKHPLDLNIFKDREVAVHNYEPKTDSYVLDIPNGFLLQRMWKRKIIVTEDAAQEFKLSSSTKTYKKLTPEIWQEDQLISVGGHNWFFCENHMAHYHGWTIVVCLDKNDNEWAAQAVNSLCYNIPQFMQANENSNIASSGIPEFFSTKEEAYVAIKNKIDTSTI